jgi:hypothetical protein
MVAEFPAFPVGTGNFIDFAPDTASWSKNIPLNQ